jgi:hypothetical protein
MKSKISQKELKEVLNYNPDTGIFTWLVDRGANRTSGKIAGHIDCHGYRSIGIDGKYYKAHRLAWLYVHGEFPPNEIDHINGNGIDNRLDNLRPVTSSENSQNQKMRDNNKSGVMGVYWYNKSKKWLARIRVNTKEIHLGVYKDLELAALVRAEAEVKYGFHPNHGRSIG